MHSISGAETGEPEIATVRSRAPGDGGTLDPAKPPRFRILGSLRVDGDEPVQVTARRQQVVLALLLLNGNRTVTLDTLFDAIWDGDPPETARAQVQTCVSALRRAMLGAGLGERIRVRDGGYAIEVGKTELDLLVYERLVVRGRAAAANDQPAAARAAFREALSLCRGEPLTGINSDALRAHRVRIGERQVEVLEDCIDAELQLGRHREVVGEVSTLLTEHPLRERLAGQLMTALYRCGRQAEALAVYRLLRQRFVEELGLEPGPFASQVHQEILNGALAGVAVGGGGGADTGTFVARGELREQRERREQRVEAPGPASAAMPVPRMLPARVPYFTGHRELLGTLRRRLVEERGRDAELVVVITGRGGVGKTTVANEAANDVAAEFPDGQLYARMAVDGERTENVSNILKQFLSALGFAPAQIPAGMEDRAALYRSAIAGRRVLAVVDDAADEAQVGPLVPSTPSCRLIITTRARTAPLLGSAVFELDVFGRADGVELLAAMIGRDRIEAETRAAGELVGLCGGLQLALCSAAARLVARPHWTIGEFVALLRDENSRLDQLDSKGFDIRATFRRGYLTLSPIARHLFAQLGLLESNSFEARVAAQLLAHDAGSVAEALESLVDARLTDVVSGTGAAARYRLHELVRIFAHECVYRN